MLVVVMGCAGKEERFRDCVRLAEWVGHKLEGVKEQKGVSLGKSSSRER